MGISSSDISRYINEIQSELGRTPAGRMDSLVYGGVTDGDSGLFDTAEAAVEAAIAAQRKLMSFALADREKFIAAIRQAARGAARELAELAHEETGYGHVED